MLDSLSPSKKRRDRFCGIPKVLLVPFGYFLFLPFFYLPALAEPATLPRLLAAAALLLWATPLLLKAGLWRAIWHQWWGRCLLAYLLWQGLSLFWSSHRPDTLLALIKNGIALQIFVLCASLTRHHREWPMQLTRALQAALLGLCLIGFWQIQGKDVPPFQQVIPPALTLINKNLASQYLALLLPLSLYLALTAETRGKQLWHGVNACLSITLIAVVLSRATWLSLLAATAACLGFWLFRHRATQTRTKRMRKEPLLVLAIILSLALLLMPYGWNAQKQPWTQRIRNDLASALGAENNPRLNTGKVRLAMYRNALAMWADHPLLGVGLGNFRSTYPRYHSAVMPTPTFSATVQPQRLHNDHLQVLVELGPVGAVLWCSFLLLLTWQLVVCPNPADSHEPSKRFWPIRLGNPRLLGYEWALLAGLLVFLFNMGLSFPIQMPLLQITFWAILGTLAGKTLKTGQHESHPAGALLLVPLNLGLALCILRWMLASWLLHHSDLYLIDKHYPQAQAYAEHAHRVFPLDWHNADRFVTAMVADPGNPPRAKNAVDLFLQMEPHNPNGFFRLAIWHQGNRLHEDALRAIDKALELAGPSADTLTMRASILMSLGRHPSARAALQQALTLDPEYQPAKHLLHQLEGPP